jgi:hypothetical protein
LQDAIFELFAAGRINKRKLSNGRYLAQQPKRLQPPLLDVPGTPRKLGGPADLALDLLDELADPRSCGIDLLALDTDKECPLLTIGKPDVD